MRASLTRLRRPTRLRSRSSRAGTFLGAVALSVLLALPATSSAAGYPERDSGYHDYREMIDLIRDIADEHPDIVRVRTIGRSWQRRPIHVVEVSDNVGQDEGEPEVMFDGLHHAREHLSAEMPLYILRLLSTQYGKSGSLGERITRIVDSRRVWLIPMVNPDGLQFDLGGDPYRSWRKNRQPNGSGRPVGTDLNRNYDYMWSKGDPKPSSHDYRGRRPFSAPETRAVRDFVLSRRVNGVQRIRTHISFHTAGEQVLWPYGYTYKAVPPDMTRVDARALEAMGRHMASTNGYRAMQSSDLYPTFGDEIDWLYGTQRIFSYTFELFPKGGGTGRHYPPDERIARETRRNREAVLYLMEQADCPYRATGHAGAFCGPLYDDMEVARGWRVDPKGTDTARAGAWTRGTPTRARFQSGGARSGRAVLVTGAGGGSDVDRGRTSIRSRPVRLPDEGTATLRARYWVGMSASADAKDRFLVRLVRPQDGRLLFTALAVEGHGRIRRPAWRSLYYRIPAELRGRRVAIELMAIDAGGDATVEAAVDDVRITVGGS
jgi:murein tripeptide amidase MpaA